MRFRYGRNPAGRGAAASVRRVCAVVALLLASVLLAAHGAPGALAAADKLFEVDAIAEDVQAQDAAQAKVKAILQAQREAFLRLVRRLAGEKAATRLARLPDRDIGRLMSSLSIADEHTGPTRYIARITVRFRPGRLTRLLRRKGIAFITRQAPPVLVVPVWEGADGVPVLWEDNPWLKAWRKLASEHALAPVVLPVGDEVDRQTLTAEQASQGDRDALQALQLRYDTEHVLVAIARPVDDNTVQAAMVGKAPGGRVQFDKTYHVEEGGLDAAAEQAVRRFLAVMTMKWRKRVLERERRRAAERAAERAARTAAERAARAAGMTVVVPFSSLREWQQLRARLISTPGVAGVDVRSLSGTHAVVRLATSLPPGQLRQALSGSGLLLRQSGGRWYLQAY